MNKFNKTLLEYSVIYTNRTTNLMSKRYQQSMLDITNNLCNVYGAEQCVLIPGSGTTGMESVARQYGNNQTCFVIKNGYFSHRWSQIFEVGGITNKLYVINADLNNKNILSPPNIDTVCDWIEKHRPKLVCAPHVETSTGVILPDEYILQIGKSTKKVGGLFCLDGIASGTIWTNMKDLGIDIFLTAPQKGWSSPASVGVVMLGQRALDTIHTTKSSSFTLDLNKWCDVSTAYQKGGFMYHCTVPTDSLIEFDKNIQETLDFGIDNCKDSAIQLGIEMRNLLEVNGYKSVAANKYKSPTVVVSYCENNMFQRLLEQGIQVAGSVPFMIDEPKGLNTFRIGLFGLDKLKNTDQTLNDFKMALDKLNPIPKM